MKGSPTIGDIVELSRHDGKFLGLGFYNPNSLIAFRHLTFENEEIGFRFLQKRISKAADLRDRIYPKAPMVRLVHSESDFLPGLIVDKFRDYLTVQTYSYGMDKRLTLICDVLESNFSPRGIIERNESPLRALEGLPDRKGILRGTVQPVEVSEDKVTYQVDLLEGQKTGFYLDQRDNRLLIRRYADGANVLDCFCNDGGFSLHAAAGGAKKALGIDSSEAAIARAERNADLSGYAKSCSFLSADVFEMLKDLLSRNERFDLIILDPPSFTKSKKNLPAAKRGYKEINSNSMRLLTDGGILATASCSHHVSGDLFMEVLAESARMAGRSLRLLEWRGASLDHPVLPAMPETGYLKFAILLVQ